VDQATRAADSDPVSTLEVNMSIHSRFLVSLGAVVVLFAAFDPAMPRAEAQSATAEPELAVAATPTRAQARADALRAKADAVPAIERNYRRIMALRLQAARAAPASDPGRIWDLELSAKLAFYLGSFEESWDLFLRSAYAALELGEVYRAGNAYLNAAHVGGQLGDRRLERYALERADRLSQSPLLGLAARNCLGNRIRVAQAAP
jgi:hypothetical protein